jgi:hypothetical protein
MHHPLDHASGADAYTLKRPLASPCTRKELSSPYMHEKLITHSLHTREGPLCPHAHEEVKCPLREIMAPLGCGYGLDPLWFCPLPPVLVIGGYPLWHGWWGLFMVLWGREKAPCWVSEGAEGGVECERNPTYVILQIGGVIAVL